MQDLSKKIKFLKIRKKIWRSWPYRFYLKVYDYFLKLLLRFNKKNVRIIFINGMRRSGNHYLMKTIMDSSSSSIIFYNNQIKLNNLDIKNGIQTKFRTSKDILLIVGYEDLLVDEFINSSNYIVNNSFSHVKNLKLIIIRDIRNIMASRLNHARMSKQLRKKDFVFDSTRELWLNHHSIDVQADFATIRYNNLIQDLSKIDLNPYFISSLIESKKILNRYGGGSSFENKNFNSRYLHFEGDEIYESLVEDFKMIDEQIHGNW